MSDTLSMPKCEWKEVKLEDIVLSANTGLDAIRRAPIVEEDTGIKCLRIQDISQSKKFENWGNSKVKESDFEKARLRKGDLIMARTCSPGIVLNVKADMNAVFNNGLARIRPKLDRVTSDYLYYLFKSRDFIGHIYGISTGTSVQLNMKLGDLLSYEFNLPVLAEQRAIASVLSSLDDKIGLLHRQNQTLEQMAETLFRQWFVEEADEGWEERPLSEYFQLLGGFAFKSKDYLDAGKYKVITIKGVQDGYLDSNSAARLDVLPEKIKPYQVLKIGDVLMSLTGNVGRVCLVDEENCLLNQRVAKIEPINKKWKAFAYFYFRQNEMIERLTYLSKGSAQLNLSPVETLAQTEPFPDDSSINNYCEVVSPFLSKIMKNKTQIRTLTALRDSLLPKLMSGEIRIV